MSIKKLQMKKWMFLLVFGCFCINGFSQSLKDADIAFKQENYSKAIDIWSKKLEKKQGDPSQLYNNIGIAYSKEKEMGKAILYFEKAVKENFNNEKAQRNLKIIRAKLNLSNENIQLFFVIWWRSLIDLFSIFTWQIIMLFLFFLAVTIYFYQKIKSSSTYNKIIYSLISIGFVVFLIIISKNSQLSNKTNAIIDLECIGYKDANLSQKLSIIRQGERVTIKDELENNVLISNDSDSTFWIEKNNLKRI